jgi:hypothetical protein
MRSINISGTKKTPAAALEVDRMKTPPQKTHVLLKVETVRSLKRLQNQSGHASLDDLIVKMISLTDAHRSSLKDLGWRVYKGNRNDNDDSMQPK